MGSRDRAPVGVWGQSPQQLISDVVLETKVLSSRRLEDKIISLGLGLEIKVLMVLILVLTKKMNKS